MLLALLAELYENLPEVGDLDKPKLVFFFDEAHALFKDAPAVLLEKIELIVRLVRSKGVGVYFITQNPTDIPDKVASQLANRIQHGLRAFTPKELKTVKTVADTFRQEANQDLAKVIQELKVGEAVVSTLTEDGSLSLADRVLIYPPQSLLGTIDPTVKASLMNSSPLDDKYGEAIDRESAHEVILKQTQEQEAALLAAAQAEEAAEVEEEEDEDVAKTSKKSTSTGGRKTDNLLDRFIKNVVGQVGREVGCVVSRGITGMFKK